MLLLAWLAGGAGCAVESQTDSWGAALPPQLAPDHARMRDGHRLALYRWAGSPEPPKVVVLGLHGFNDHARAFDPLARTLAASGTTTYAYDQRGFGTDPRAGRWPGDRLLADDLQALVQLLRQRHPRARLIVVGESMGAAVAMLAQATRPLDIDGLVLIAPAVWSRRSMPWYQSLALDTLVQLAPGLRLSGQGLDIRPTDNRPLLRAMSADPLVIKATRVDALWGVTNLMDQASAAAGRVPTPTLLLYGEHDQIIPRDAFCSLLARLPPNRPPRLVLYQGG